jgi:hypothetical protein
MAGFIFLALLATIVTIGAAYSASRVPAAVSRLKVVFVIFLIFAVMAGWRWLTGEEDLSGLSLLLYPMGILGISVCAFTILGATIGVYRQQRARRRALIKSLRDG